MAYTNHHELDQINPIVGILEAADKCINPESFPIKNLHNEKHA